MKVIIDRFEGDYAVVELPDLTMVDMPRSLIRRCQRRCVGYRNRSDETDKKRIEKLMNDLWE